ncbi:WXG100 family type VII secretion target [Streptomyces sp. NPDC091972]|uniref:WXG100 family type VII secretion target n=1 Tax=Streptomyces sp. NPDC091972 TaxID=3366007 RepID=UPI003807762D
MGDKDVDDFEYVETNQCISAQHTTPFGLNYDMDQMKDMVRDADPGTVKRVAAAWEALSKDLVGPGGIKETLDAAVEHVLAHWEGQSADLFRARAQVIGKKITDSSKYATHTSTSLKGAAATLEQIKPEVMAMEKPGKVSSALDYIGNMGDRDDSGANNALKSGAGSQQALDGNAGSLSEGREAQLRMAAKMETLGAAYNSRAAEMGSWKPGRGVDHADDYPGDPGGVAPAPVLVPTETVTRSPQHVATGTARGSQINSTISSPKAVTPPSGITGGAHKPTVSQPQVGTAIDGISGGRTGTPTVGGGTTSVGGGAAAGGGVGAGFVGGAVGGAAGAGAARGGMIGRTGAGAGAGAGGVAGRAGASGVGGAGASKGATGRVGGTARGGVVGGTPKSGAGAGRGTAGGSGLHSSRGAVGKGASAVRKGGIAGAPGSRTGRRKEDEQREGERPDYLVEDEETWTPQTNTAPRVIE